VYHLFIGLPLSYMSIRFQLGYIVQCVICKRRIAFQEKSNAILPVWIAPCTGVYISGPKVCLLTHAAIHYKTNSCMNMSVMHIFRGDWREFFCDSHLTNPSLIRSCCITMLRIRDAQHAYCPSSAIDLLE
jgi:hypothetical protein